MTELTRKRVVIDVSSLPETAFGVRGVSWWATGSFMLVEGTTLAVVLTAYLYLRMNSAEWPPRPASNPDLLIPTINMLLLIVAMWPAYLLRKACKRVDPLGVLRWLTVLTGLSAVACVLRFYEYGAVNVRWDTNAYGSAVWAVLTAHTSLLITDLLESGVMAYFFATRRNTMQHFSDADESGEYQYFLSVAWLVCYCVVIIGPRIL